MTARRLSIIGSVVYLLWSALHIQAAYKVMRLADSVQPSMIRGRLNQDAWMLLCAAVVVGVVSVLMLRRTSPLGYWLNLGVAGVSDIGFIAFVLVPGYAKPWPGLEGPVLWGVAWMFSTAGLVMARRGSAERVRTEVGDPALH